jgi:hypothetical protein
MKSIGQYWVMMEKMRKCSAQVWMMNEVNTTTTSVRLCSRSCCCRIDVFDLLQQSFMVKLLQLVFLNFLSKLREEDLEQRKEDRKEYEVDIQAHPFVSDEKQYPQRRGNKKMLLKLTKDLDGFRVMLAF